MSRLAPLLAVLVLAGCGSSVRTVTRVERVGAGCTGITTDRRIGYAICDGRRFLRDGEPLPITVPPGAKVGHWAKAFLSPDGETFLAQWSAECEVPFAFYVPVRGGRPRVVTGERDWTTAPKSVADGWTADGRALVELTRSECGRSAKRPGVYMVALDGRREWLAPVAARGSPAGG